MANSAHCPLEDCARVYPTYDPSLGGNVTFLVLFAVLIPVALAMGFRYHNMVFSTALTTGFALEVMGYIGQVLLSNGKSSRASYIVFLLGTILGPNFIFGAMFLVMPHVVRLYGQEFKGWRPSWYRAMFYGLSILSLALELAGSFVATGSSYDTVGPSNKPKSISHDKQLSLTDEAGGHWYPCTSCRLSSLSHWADCFRRPRLPLCNCSSDSASYPRCYFCSGV